MTESFIEQYKEPPTWYSLPIETQKQFMNDVGNTYVHHWYINKAPKVAQSKDERKYTK